MQLDLLQRFYRVGVYVGLTALLFLAMLHRPGAWHRLLFFGLVGVVLVWIREGGRFVRARKRVVHWVGLQTLRMPLVVLFVLAAAVVPQF